MVLAAILVQGTLGVPISCKLTGVFSEERRVISLFRVTCKIFLVSVFAGNTVDAIFVLGAMTRTRANHRIRFPTFQVFPEANLYTGGDPEVANFADLEMSRSGFPDLPTLYVGGGGQFGSEQFQV